MHTVPKWVLDNAVYVLLDCVIYCACYSILFRGGGAFFPDTVYLIYEQ